MLTIGRSLFSPNHFTHFPLASSHLKRWIAHKPREKEISSDFLYAVANGPSFSDKNELFFKAMRAAQGGACLQYRDLESDFSIVLNTCIQLKKMLQRVGVPLMTNTRYPMEIARAINADGVYLEDNFSDSETRMTLKEKVIEARTILGEKAIIGIPVRKKEEIFAAEEMPVNFLSVKIAPSQRTSPGDDITWGSEGLREVRALSSHRLVAIGAMTPASAEQIYGILRPGDMIAMAGGIMNAEDPCAVAQEMHIIWKRAREGS